MEQRSAGGDAGKGSVFFRGRDLWVIALLLLGAGLIWLLFFAQRAEGGRAVVLVGFGKEQTQMDVPLGEDAVLHIEGGELPVTLEVKDGAIRFIHSVCPDHICENTGWLRREWDEATCLPARVVVQVREEHGG